MVLYIDLLQHHGRWQVNNIITHYYYACYHGTCHWAAYIMLQENFFCVWKEEEKNKICDVNKLDKGYVVINNCQLFLVCSSPFQKYCYEWGPVKRGKMRYTVCGTFTSVFGMCVCWFCSPSFFLLYGVNVTVYKSCLLFWNILYGQSWVDSLHIVIL